MKLLWLLPLLLGLVRALRLDVELDESIEFAKLAEFDFSPGAGVLTLSSSVSFSKQERMVMLVERARYLQFLRRFDALASYCDLQSITLHSYPLTNAVLETQVQGGGDGGEFVLLYAKVLPCNVKFNVQKMHLVSVSGDDSRFIVHLHLKNWDLGLFQEFASLFWMVKIVAMFFYLVLCARFQLSTLRLVWRNTGVSLAAYMFALVVLETSIYAVRLLGVFAFILTGASAWRDPSPTLFRVWGEEILFETAYLLLLVLLAQGWMISSPNLTSVSKLPLALVLLHPITVLLHRGAFTHRVLVFVVVYSNLVRIMKRSRAFPLAVTRGKAFGPVASLLLLWFLNPWRTGNSVFLAVLVWTFRAEVLWEMHGERPHIEVAKLLDQRSAQEMEEEEEESEGLLRL